tara:strand:- start:740 stop:1039 length:300 start_codon:yes stop_codon:yes gene_type:complete
MSEDQTLNQESNQEQPVPSQAQTVPSTSPVMTIGDYMVTMLVGYITCGIMWLVWAFSKGTNQNKANFCKAILIFWLIASVLYFVIVVLILGAGAMASGF